MSYTIRTEQDALVRQQLIDYGRMAARRERAKAELLEPIMPDEMYRLIAGSEGLGFIGDPDRIGQLIEDFNRLQYVELTCQAVKERLSPQEYEPYQRHLKMLRAKLYALSFTYEVLNPVLPGEVQRKRDIRAQTMDAATAPRSDEE